MIVSQKELSSSALSFEADYREWCISNVRKKSEDTIQEALSFYGQSELVLDNFKSLSNTLRGATDVFRGAGSDLRDIETWMRIALKLQVERPALVARATSGTAFNEELKRAVFEKLSRSEADRFFSLMLKVQRQYTVSYTENREYRGCSLMLAHVALPYVLMEDPKIVLSVFSLWSEARSPLGSISDLIALMDEWDTVKDFPFDWALYYARG